MKTVDHSYEQALIMHDNLHIHVIMNIIVTPTATAAEPQSSKKWKREGSGERGRQLGRSARALRPPSHCHQCDQSGHMSYACPDLKKVKRGELKLKAHLCPLA